LRWFSLVPGEETVVAFVLIDERAVPDFLIYGCGIGAVAEALADGIEEAVAACGALYVTSNTLVGARERALTLRARELALSAGKPVAVDANLRPGRWADLELALGLVRSLGAHEAIDCTRADFTKSGETYDVIIDAVGKNHPYSFRRSRRSLNPGGSYLPTDGLRNVFLWLWHKRFGDKKVLFELPPRMRKEDVLLIKQLIEAGGYRPVIDRTYPLEDAVEAHRYVQTGHKTGNVVLTLVEGGR